MNPFEVLDRLWERCVARWPRLSYGDRTDADTWTHHAALTVVLWGGGAVIFDLLLGRALYHAWSIALAVGIAAGLAWYAAREIWARRKNHHYKLHDGVGDVLHPLWVTLPWLLSGLYWRAGLALFLLSAAVLAHKLLSPRPDR